jgi:peptidoglycan/LPS O-acetylase OafA/YrhL
LKTIKPNNYIPSLHGLRAISIILVILCHIYIKVFKNQIGYDSLHWLEEMGPLGVNIFFVISGFLITTLLLKEENNSGTIQLKQFYLRRTLRIFPAYYFMLLVYGVLCIFNYIAISNASWLTAITYTKYFNFHLDWFTAHAWSLSVEEQFYLIWPLIFKYLPIHRNKIIVFIILLVPVVRTICFKYPIIYFHDLSLFFRADALAIGCYTAFNYNKIVTILSKRFNSYLILLIISLIVLDNLYEWGYIFTSKIGYFTLPFGTLYGTCANIIIAAILVISINARHTVWFAFLNSKPLKYIGVLSYSLYLWQQLFLSNTANLVFTIWPYSLLFLGIAAWCSYQLIEKPFLKWKATFNK